MESQEPAERPRRARGGPRLYHTKSKTGCVRCRARRVKCDESQPVCNNCHRHNVACEYDRILGSTRAGSHVATVASTVVASTPVADRPVRWSSPHSVAAIEGPPGAVVVSSAVSTVSSVVSTATSMVLSAGASASLSPASVPSNSSAGYASSGEPPTALPASFSLRSVYWEMRALHHFTLATSRTLPGNHLPSIADCWAAKVPVLAMEYEPLMRALIALASLHLITGGCTDANLVHCRVAYLDAALRAHREELPSSTRDSTTASAVCFTSILLLIDAFATLHERALAPYEPPTQWLWIVQGTRSIFEACYPVVKNDPGSSIMILISSAHFYSPANVYTKDNAVAFQYLLVGAAADAATKEDPEVLPAYQSCVTYIGSIWTAVQAGEPVMGLCRRLMSFACASPVAFLQLVENKVPRALVVLAHFFALTAYAKDIWWVGNTASREVQAIYEYLGPEMQPLMEWPLQIVASVGR